MRAVKSCGVIVFRREPEPGFLLMRHADRYDLPKGHIRPDETEVACARRELAEETGMSRDAVQLDEDFRHATTYRTRYRRYGGATVEKTVVIFLGRLVANAPIAVSEHAGYAWLPWRPPHRIEAGTIDGVLAELERCFPQGP
jgi:8-oxo-dGTP pyrophosphatase MutT (NUDIX family)